MDKIVFWQKPVQKTGCNNDESVETVFDKLKHIIEIIANIAFFGYFRYNKQDF
ncbi:hypothetical protein KGQ24_02760 [Patescibacteria group bacterium]|nr:hypothetical protein [Patescibacteria group bacterium]